MTDRLSCQRRRWGKTELSIPVVPFGTQGFGDNFGPVRNEEALALKEGVVERSEVIISGRVCHHSAAEWGGYGEGTPDYSAERTLVDVQDQLTVLDIEKFDVIFLHDPPEVGPALDSGGSLEGLEQARDLNLVDFIGFGMHPHLSHLAAIESGRVDVLVCFSDYNLLRQSASEDILPAAVARDLGVLNGWSIMRGWLTGVPVERFVPRDRCKEDHQRAEAMRL